MSSTTGVASGPRRYPLLRLARLLGLIVEVVVLLPLLTILLTLVGIFGRRPRVRAVMALTAPVCSLFARTMGVRIVTRGERATGGRLFVGNHVSYLDILVAAVGVSGLFVSRHDVRSWPVIGLFARLAGTIFIDRSSLRSAIESSAGIVERGSEGARVVLFPEGGTTSGESVAPFRPFLFAAILERRLTIQPFTIRYCSMGGEPILPSQRHLVHWFDPAPPFHTHAWRLLALRSVTAEIRFLSPVEPPATDTREGARMLAEDLRRRISEALFTA